MRIVCVNQDRGIGPQRSKGAAVHLVAVRAALRRAGCEVVELDEPDEGRLARRLASELSLGADLVYERYALGKDAALAACQAAGVPHALEVNAPLIEEAARYRDHRPTNRDHEAEDRLFSESQHVVCVSSAARSAVVRARGHGRGVVVEPNAVGPEFLGSIERRQDFVSPDRVVIGFHGRVRPWHAFDRTVRLVAELAAEGHSVQLAVVGEGDLDGALAELPDDAVRRMAWVPPQDVPAYVACFDLVVLPYRADAPPWFSPLKLAEAMALGAVPLVTDVGDLPLLVEHGESGLVVPAMSDGALFDGARELVRDGDLRARLSEGARVRGRARTWDDVVGDLLERVRALGAPA